MRCTNKTQQHVCLSLSRCVCVCVPYTCVCWSFVVCVCAGAAKLISSWGIVKYINIVHFGSTSSPCSTPHHSNTLASHTQRETERERERDTVSLCDRTGTTMAAAAAGVVRRVGTSSVATATATACSLLQLKSMVSYGNLWAKAEPAPFLSVLLNAYQSGSSSK